MSVNNMSFQDAATVLNGLVAQQTGETALAPIANAGDYISVGTSLLKTGIDPLATGISQMVQRTLFAIREYRARLEGAMDVDNDEWGAVTRKINAIDADLESEEAYALTDGQSKDQWTVKKPRLFQTNFYGYDVWRDHVSVTEQQLKNAVLNPAEMGQLLGLILGNKDQTMQQSREAFRRMNLCNYIGALAQLDGDRVVHLATEYCTEMGIPVASGTDAATIVKAQANYGDFIKWAYARIAQVSDLMTHRGAAFHTLPTDGQGNALPLMRVTPKEDQKILVLASDLHQIGARVLADTFNSSMVSDKLPYTESVAFWQALKAPDQVSVAPAYMAADGTITQGNQIQVSNVFAVIYDRWALGINLHDQRVAVTPLNANGLYVNYWYHEARRAYMDITENGVLFLAD